MALSVFEEVTLLVSQYSGGNVFWTSDHIIDAINEAQIELAFRLKPSTISVSWVTGVGADLVDVPDEIMIPLSIHDASRSFFPTTQAKLEQHSRGWKGQPPSVPEWFVLFDNRTIRPWPRPDDNYQYTMVGIPWPTETFGLAVVLPNTTLPYREALVYRAAGELLEFTQPLLSDQLMKESEAKELQFKKLIRNQHSHNIRRIHPGNNMSGAKSGVIKLGRNF